MLRRCAGRTEDETGDSGAETAGSDCSKMSCSSMELMPVPAQDLLPVTLHLLSNPGDSLLLQHTLDGLLKWVRPGLRLFHVSERSCPLHASHLRPGPGLPSHAVTLFLHESLGEERVLQVLDVLQSPPWHYHHTEDPHGPLRPYLLPRRDFFRLGFGMPVWAVRSVHCGGEAVRVTLHCSFDNFEDTVRLYETVLRRGAEEQKSGFCWFTLLSEPGFGLQLALKQLPPGVPVQPCPSAVLQFRVGEIGQLVPLLPNTCAPISATRWHTQDLDGNKILFQVNAPARAPGVLRSAFPLSACPVLSSRGLRSCRTASRLKEVPEPQGLSRDSLGSDGTSRTPPGSSCYSSQRSSPAGPSWDASLSRRRLEEEETDVDTGRAVNADLTLTERTDPQRDRGHHTPEHEFFI